MASEIDVVANGASSTILPTKDRVLMFKKL